MVQQQVRESLKAIAKRLSSSKKEEVVRQAFLEFTSRVDPRVRRWLATKYELHPDDFDDTMSETWIVVWRSRKRVDPDGYPQAFVATIAKRKYLATLRRQHDETTGCDLDQFEDSGSSEHQNERDVAETNGQLQKKLRWLSEKIRQFKKRDREILHEWANSRNSDCKWVTDEFAKELGKTPSYIRVRLHRILKRLRGKVDRLPGTRLRSEDMT